MKRLVIHLNNCFQIYIKFREYRRHSLTLNNFWLYPTINNRFSSCFKSISLSKCYDNYPQYLTWCKSWLSCVVPENSFQLATLNICYAEEKIFISFSYAIKPSNFLSLIISFDVTYFKNDIKMARVWKVFHHSTNIFQSISDFKI